MLLGLEDVARAAKLPLRALGLSPKVMAQESALSFYSSGRGQLEAFFGAAVRLHLQLSHESGGV